MADENIQRVIDIARAEVGYIEKETHEDLDDPTANAGDQNYTKYARDLAELPYFNGSKCGVAWCSVFVSWCFVRAFGEKPARKLLCQPEKAEDNSAAGCTSALKYYKNKERLFADPEIGDQIFFWNSQKTEVSHTGLVVGVDAEYVYTVEGNTSGTSGVVSNGGMVCEKKYQLDYGRIAGYGAVDWSALGEDGETRDAHEEPDADERATIGVAWVATGNGGDLNVRTGPGKKYDIIGRVLNGSCVDVLEKTSSEWWRVSQEGMTGYVAVEFLQTLLADGLVTITMEHEAAIALMDALMAALGR